MYNKQQSKARQGTKYELDKEGRLETRKHSVKHVDVSLMYVCMFRYKIL